MRNSILASIFLAIGIASCASSAPDPAPSTPAAPVNGYIQVLERVDRHVHVMRQPLPNFAGVVGNVTIIEQAHGLVLVDSGSSYGDGQRVVAAVRSVSAKPVTAVIITHWHNDHPLGLTAIREAWPDIQIIATETTATRLRDGLTNVPTARDLEWEAQRVQTIEGYRTTLIQGKLDDETLSQAERDGWARAGESLPVRAASVAGTYLVLPNRTFQDRLTLDDSIAPIEVRFEGRANTDGDAEVWLPRQRILVAGDAVVWPVPYMFSIHTIESAETLERLRAIDFATLIPGHGEVLHDKTYLDLVIAFTRDVQAEVAPLAQSGKTLEEVTAQVTASAYVERFAGGDPWLRYWFQRYALAPLIESAYREAKGETFDPS